MPAYQMEIEYTRHDGTTCHEFGTHVITRTDGRHSSWRQANNIIANARYIASAQYPTATLIGLRQYGTDRIMNLPDGRRNIPIVAMNLEERQEYR